MERLRRWLIGIVIFVLLPSLVAAAWVWHRAQERRQELVKLYEEVAQEHRAEAYPRAEGTPGWELEAGDAADPYQQAWDACDLENWPERTAETLRRTRLALFEPELRARDAPELPLFDPGERVVPSPCVALGVPEGTSDRLLAQLDGDLCERLDACRPALRLMDTGSRRADATSPMRIWSEFATVAPGQLRSFVPFLRLGQLRLLEGYLAGANGDRDAHLDAIFATMRMGQDVSRGSGLIGAMVAVAILDRASRDLEWLLLRDELTVGQASRARVELAYINRHPLDVASALRAEFLNLGGMWFEPGEVALPPTSIPLETAARSIGDRLATRLASRELAQSWRDLLETQDLVYPDRARQYPRIEQRSGASDNLLIAAQPDYGRFDARITAASARLVLLQVAFHDVLFRRERGRLPASVEELAGAATLDPLSGEPFEMESLGEQRFLSSPALWSAARLGLDDVTHQIRPEVYLRIQLPGGLGEPQEAPSAPVELPTGT